jgi:hypothetical protein
MFGSGPSPGEGQEFVEGKVTDPARSYLLVPASSADRFPAP